VIQYLSPFATGLVFGLGLWLSGMAYPKKVLAFLDVAGHWDPSLLLVMAGAVAATLVGFRIALGRPAPLFAPRFMVPSRRDIDVKLVGGAALFGLGWGIGGYCPGPGLTALSTLSSEAVLFVAAMIAGGVAHALVFDRTPPADLRHQRQSA
jgi:uncharacterized protein